MDDALDVALYHLPERSVERLDGKAFLRLNDIDFDIQSPTAVYSLFGFPGIWSEASTSDSEKVQLKPLQFTAFAYDQKTDALDGYQERLHLLLDAQLQRVTTQDGSPAVFQGIRGNSACFPRDLGGISGCSVWRIGDLRTPIDDWRQKYLGSLPCKPALINLARRSRPRAGSPSAH